MATGVISQPLSVKIVKKEASSNTTLDTMTFAGNNERHVLISISTTNNLCGAWILKTASQGGVTNVPILSASGMTITNGSGDNARTIKFAHSSQYVTYVDIAVTGDPLTFS